MWSGQYFLCGAGLCKHCLRHGKQRRFYVCQSMTICFDGSLGPVVPVWLLSHRHKAELRQPGAGAARLTGSLPAAVCHLASSHRWGRAVTVDTQACFSCCCKDLELLLCPRLLDAGKVFTHFVVVFPGGLQFTVGLGRVVNKGANLGGPTCLSAGWFRWCCSCTQRQVSDKDSKLFKYFY